MIVVAIIGILAAVAIPQYQNYVARAQVAEGLSLASGIKTAIAEYHSTHGTFPPGSDVVTNHTVLGIAKYTDLTGNYVKRIEVKANGKAQIFLKSDTDGVHSAIHSKSFWLIPANKGGSISWLCACGTGSNGCIGGGEPEGNAIEEKYLPSSCLLASNFDIDPDDLTLDPASEPDPVLWADAKTSDNACWDGSDWVVGNLSPAMEDKPNIHALLDGYAEINYKDSINSDWECYP